MSDPTTPEDDDAALAATITPEDLGETRLPEPRGRREPRNPFEPSNNVKALIEKYASAAPEREPGHPDHEVEVTGDGRARARDSIVRGTWETSLHASSKQGLSNWRLDQLASDQHPRELRPIAKTFRAPRFRNIVFAGDVGPGKTSAAIALGWAAVEVGLTARFIDHNKYVRWTQTSDSMPGHPHPYAGISREQFIRRMTTCDFLVLDDLGRSLDTEAPVSPHVLKVTTELLEDRIETPGKITVITLNFRREQIDTMFGAAFLSRLSKDGKAFAFKGPDRRGRLDW